MAAWLLCAATSALAQDGPGPYDPEDVLAAKLPNGNYVEVGVSDDLGYELDVCNSDLKKLTKLDGSAFWGEEFAPAILIPIDNDRVLALDRPVEKGKRPGRVVNIKTGKFERNLSVALPKIRGVWLLPDKSLLAWTGGEMIRFKNDGSIISTIAAIVDGDGKKLSIAKFDAVAVTENGSISMFDDKEHRILMLDDRFRYRSRVILPKNRSFTQEMGAGKGCFWFEDFVEGMKLVRVDMNGKVTDRTMSFADNSEISWIQFMGETSKGDPVFYFSHLYAVPPIGRVHGLVP